MVEGAPKRPLPEKMSEWTEDQLLAHGLFGWRDDVREANIARLQKLMQDRQALISADLAQATKALSGYTKWLAVATVALALAALASLGVSIADLVTGSGP